MSQWTEAEDEILKKGVQKYGTGKWAAVSALLPTRNSKEVKRRYENVIRQDSHWTDEKDKNLMHFAKVLKNNWATIAEFVGMPPQKCVERAELLENRAAGLDDSAPLISATSAAPEHQPAVPNPQDLDDETREAIATAEARMSQDNGRKAQRKLRERTEAAKKEIAVIQAASERGDELPEHKHSAATDIFSAGTSASSEPTANALRPLISNKHAKSPARSPKSPLVIVDLTGGESDGEPSPKPTLMAPRSVVGNGSHSGGKNSQTGAVIKGTYNEDLGYKSIIGKQAAQSAGQQVQNTSGARGSEETQTKEPVTSGESKFQGNSQFSTDESGICVEKRRPISDNQAPSPLEQPTTQEGAKATLSRVTEALTAGDQPPMPSQHTQPSTVVPNSGYKVGPKPHGESEAAPNTLQRIQEHNPDAIQTASAQGQGVGHPLSHEKPNRESASPHSNNQAPAEGVTSCPSKTTNGLAKKTVIEFDIHVAENPHIKNVQELEDTLKEIAAGKTLPVPQCSETLHDQVKRWVPNMKINFKCSEPRFTKEGSEDCDISEVQESFDSANGTSWHETIPQTGNDKEEHLSHQWQPSPVRPGKSVSPSGGADSSPNNELSIRDRLGVRGGSLSPSVSLSSRVQSPRASPRPPSRASESIQARVETQKESQSRSIATQDESVRRAPTTVAATNLKKFETTRTKVSHDSPINVELTMDESSYMNADETSTVPEQTPKRPLPKSISEEEKVAPDTKRRNLDPASSEWLHQFAGLFNI